MFKKIKLLMTISKLAKEIEKVCKDNWIYNINGNCIVDGV